MIRWLGEEKKEGSPTSKEFNEKEKEMLKFVDEIWAKFKPKT
jgi:hypothetical protein